MPKFAPKGGAQENIISANMGRIVSKYTKVFSDLIAHEAQNDPSFHMFLSSN